VPLLYFAGSVIRDRGEEPTYDGRLWVVDPDDLFGPDGGPQDPEPYVFAAVEDAGDAATLARLLNDGEMMKAQRDALLSACLEARVHLTGTLRGLPMDPDHLARTLDAALKLARRQS
jgi:hypothetical protein